MRLSFIFPAALALLVLLVPIWVLAFAAPRRPAPRRFWSALLVRSALVITLVLALAGPQLLRGTSALTTVFLLDRSASLTAEQQASAEQFARTAVAAMQPDDEVALIQFGGAASVDLPPASASALPELSATSALTATNLQSALELGLSLLPADRNGRLVLLSDGGQNEGDARAAAARAATQGVSISYVDVGVAPEDGAVLLALDAPATARIGQQFALDATVASSTAQNATLRVIDGTGQIVSEQQVTLQPGTNRLPAIPALAQSSGFQRYRAELLPQNDTQPQNNAAEALVRVDGAGRVLVVEGAPGESQALTQALTQAQITTETIAPQAIPTDLSALVQYDAVILANASANDFPTGSGRALRSYVRDLGRGLVMIGGERSYGAGNFGGSPVEEALPVYMDVRDQRERPSIALMFVLDKSSSMDSCHCQGPDRETDGFFDHNGRPKLDVGKDAVAAAVATLGPQDTVGVVAFNDAADVPFPPRTNATPEEILAAIGPIPPKGATNVFAGLSAAETALAGVNAGIKHVVLLTDGWSDGGDPLEVAGRMRASGITLSVVAEGVGSAPYLQQLADAGGGRYIPITDPNSVPQLFLQETRQIAGNYLIEQPVTPAYGVRSPMLSGLEDGLPQLYGYNGTTAKQSANIALTGLDDAPILASWQYGLGQSVAWTSDTTGRWAKDWLAWPGFPRFVAQVVGAVLPSTANPGLDARISSAEGRTTIEVTALQGSNPRSGLTMQANLAGGTAAGTVPLAPVAPGIYRGDIATPPQGTYLVQITGTSGGQTVTQETVGFVVPYPAEFRPAQANPALLAELAQTSGGRQLRAPAESFERVAGGGAQQAREIFWPLLALALMLFVVDVVLRRLFAFMEPRPRYRR